MRVRLLSYGCSSLILFITVFLGISSSAHAQGTGAITGKATGDGNAPLIDVHVVAYRQINNTGLYFWEPAAQTVTNNNGDYTISDLEADTYRVGFFPQNYPRDYFDAYYGNVTDVYSATNVIVAAGTTVQNINIQLPSGAHIKGKVTGPAGENLQGIAVSVNGLSLSFQKSTTTNASGRYDIGGMEAGTYSIGFSDPQEPPEFATEQFDNRGRDEVPSPITLATDQIRTGINAQLDRLGLIQGRVTNMTGDPISNITVIGQRYDAVPPYPGWYDDAYGYTDTTGVYTITGLYADTYRVMFQDNQYGLYSFEWFSDTYDPGAATLLTVTLNSTTTNINAQLDGRGTISGVVTDEQGHPLVDMTVRAEYLEDEEFQTWNQAGEAYTDSDGRYTICCLNPQSYRISFWDSFQRYIYEYYDDILDPSVFQLNVTLVPVTATQNTPDINANLSRYSTIAGTVTDEENRLLSQIGVDFYRTDGGDPNYDSTAYTDENGYFSNSYLRPGHYRLRFYDTDSPQTYIEEYYDSAPDLASATDITVTKEATATISAALVSRGRITGTVTDRNGNPVEGITIGLYYPGEFDGWYYNTGTTSDSNGNYKLGGLNASTYRIGFEDNRGNRQYVNEFYDDAATIETGTDIAVTDGALVPNINAQLAALSALAGEVTNENGDPLQAISVTAYRYRTMDASTPYWESVGFMETDEGGHYQLTGLEAGDYRLRFQDYNGVYHGEWYNNQGYEAAATIFQLAVETRLTGLNAQLVAEPFSWPPYAQNDETEVAEGGTITSSSESLYSVLANDLNDSGNPLQATTLVMAQHGILTFNSDGIFSYTHDGSETSSDHFTYRVNDGLTQSNVATVTIAIQPVNDFPVANDDSAHVVRGGSISQLTGGLTSVLANDSDPDDATLTAALLTLPQHGALTLNSDGTFTYGHNGDNATSDSYTYNALDGFGASDSGTVTITIDEVALEPSLIFSKTVGIAGILPLCTTIDDMKVPVETTIVYCYAVRNTSTITLNNHSLVDSHLGQLLTNVDHVLAPNATFVTTFTQTLTVTTTNVATWTATAAGGEATVLAPLAMTVKGAATVRISGPNDDADHDSIPDNLEKVGDIDGDNIPNFLDTDADGDGVSDRDEVGDNPNAPPDSDKDGIPDYLDADSQPPMNYQQLLPLINR